MFLSTFSVPWQQLAADVASPSDNGFTAASNWIPAGSLDSARVYLEVRNRIGNIEIVPTLEFSNNVLTSGNTLVELGSYVSAEGISNPSAFTDVASSAAAAQWVRFGYTTRNTSGDSLSSCDVFSRVQVQTTDFGQTSTSWRSVLSNSTSLEFFPTTEWMSAANSASLRCAFEVRALVGNITVQPAYQTANDPQSPDTPMGLGGARSSDGITFPSSWSSLSVGGKRLIRFGWGTQLSSGSATAWAEVVGKFQYRNE